MLSIKQLLGVFTPVAPMQIMSPAVVMPLPAEKPTTVLKLPVVA